MSPFKEGALALAKLGWKVLPVHGIRADGSCTCGGHSCKAGKHPRISKWPDRATTDPTLIESWALGFAGANIGIATGLVSRLVVLDIDPGAGGEESLAALVREVGPIPVTVTARTGSGGHHFYLAYPGKARVASSQGALGDGIDVRADGGMVVAPPSDHRSRLSYAWLPHLSPFEIEVAAIPVELMSRLASLKRSPVARESKISALLTHGDTVPVGERNSTFFRAACGMRRIGFSEAGVAAAVEAEVAVRCTPRLPVAEVHEIVKSSRRYRAATFAPTPREFLLTCNLAKDERHVYRAIFDYARAGGVAWPSLRTLSIEVGMAPSTVAKHVRGLERKGALKVSRRRGCANRYRLVEPSLTSASTHSSVPSLSPGLRNEPGANTQGGEA